MLMCKVTLFFCAANLQVLVNVSYSEKASIVQTDPDKTVCLTALETLEEMLKAIGNTVVYEKQTVDKICAAITSVLEQKVCSKYYFGPFRYLVGPLVHFVGVCSIKVFFTLVPWCLANHYQVFSVPILLTFPAYKNVNNLWALLIYCIFYHYNCFFVVVISELNKCFPVFFFVFFC